MTHSQKWLLFGFLIILTIGIIWVGIFYMKRKPTPVIEKAGPVKEEGKKAGITDWKTYRNEEYGFEIKYPSDWISEEVTIQKGIPTGYSVRFEPFTGEEEIAEASFFITRIMQYSPTEKRELSFEEIIEKKRRFLKELGEWFDEKEILLDNRPAVRFSRITKEKAKIIEIYEKSKMLYFYYGESVGASAKYSSIFDKMLSTFRFLE